MQLARQRPSSNVRGAAQSHKEAAPQEAQPHTAASLMPLLEVPQMLVEFEL